MAKITSEDRRTLLKHLIVSQVLFEISDDCINRGIISKREKLETKRFISFMEKEHKLNFMNMYSIDSSVYVNLTDMVENIIKNIASLSLDEMVTFNNKINGFITETKEETPDPEQSGIDNVHRDNTEKV